MFTCVLGRNFASTVLLVPKLMFTCVLGRNFASTVLSVPKPFGGRWQRRWTCSCVEIEWRFQFWPSLEEGAGKLSARSVADSQRCTNLVTITGRHVIIIRIVGFRVPFLK